MNQKLVSMNEKSRRPTKSLIALLKRYCLFLQLIVRPTDDSVKIKNLYQASGRNRLIATSVNDLLMIGINGLPLALWNAEKYAISWLKSGNIEPWTKATGLSRTSKLASRPNTSKLFA